MKMSLRSLVRWAKGVPFISPLITVPLALYRLPLLYKRLAQVDERLAHLEIRLGAPGHGTDTLPTNDDIQNLILSTPIALRKLRRDVDLLLEATNPHPAISKQSNE
jgi:hypothetical protein